jgi:hypothetical protein
MGADPADSNLVAANMQKKTSRPEFVAGPRRSDKIDMKIVI